MFKRDRDKFRKQNIQNIINDTNQERTVILQLSVTLDVKMEDIAAARIIASVQIITRVHTAINVGSLCNFHCTIFNNV